MPQGDLQKAHSIMITGMMFRGKLFMISHEKTADSLRDPPNKHTEMSCSYVQPGDMVGSEPVITGLYWSLSYYISERLLDFLYNSSSHKGRCRKMI